MVGDQKWGLLSCITWCLELFTQMFAYHCLCFLGTGWNVRISFYLLFLGWGKGGIQDWMGTYQVGSTIKWCLHVCGDDIVPSLALAQLGVWCQLLGNISIFDLLWTSLHFQKSGGENCNSTLSRKRIQHLVEKGAIRKNPPRRKKLMGFLYIVPGSKKEWGVQGCA